MRITEINHSFYAKQKNGALNENKIKIEKAVILSENQIGVLKDKRNALKEHIYAEL